MRGGSIAILLTLLIGACPAHAQVGSVGDPNPAEQRPAVKKSRAAHKPVQKSVAKTKPTAAKPITPKPIATKPVAAKPVAAKPVATKPVAAKPVATKIAPVPVPKPEAAKAPAATATPAPPAELTSIPPAERLKIQAALYWAGDFSSEAAGDDALDAAIRSFQKRNKLKVTGALTPEQRATLVSAAASHEQEFGWTVVTDPATGVRIGLPGKLVPNTRDTAHGTRWSSPHGEVQVETFRIENTALATLFEQEKKASSRKIEHSALTEDGFIVSGMQGLKLFTVRARQRNGEIRGFTLLYDQMMEGIVAPVMVAMASAFSPFPERAAPFAALAKKVEYGTGLIVSAAGHILTASKVVHGCQVIVADNFGNAERVADDDANGLALLRVYGVHRLPALAFAGDAAKAGEITLVGIPDPKEQNGGRKLTEIKAKLADSAAIALRQPVPMAGFAGAAALDAQDRFVGIMETRNVALASSEPTLPPVRLIDAASIRDFLDSQHVPLAGAGTDARAALVRIICVRK